MKRILVTGFEPFGGSNVNVSQDIVQELAQSMQLDDPWAGQRESPDAPMLTLLEREILTVDQEGSQRTAQRIGSGEVWDGILHIGVCGTCTTPRLELRAQDRLDMRIPDNSGRLEQDTVISGSGDLASTAPIKQWLQHWHTDAESSIDAGTYLCNETLYRTLEALGTTEVPCLFLHLPKAETYPMLRSMQVVTDVLTRMVHTPVISVVGAVVIINGRFLAARRASHEAHPGTWEFPGGKVEPNEDPYRAIEREIREEFGWEIAAHKSIGTWWHRLPNVIIALDAVLCSFPEQLPSFEMEERWTSHDRVEWHTPSSSARLKFTGSDHQIVNELQQGGHLD